MKLDLNYNDKRVMHISNDAFNYMHFEDEMLDDINMAEVDEIIAMFPLGFHIEEYDFTNDDGKVIVTIIPYVETDFVPNFLVKYFNGWVMECERTGNNIKYRFVHDKIGPKEIFETVIHRNSFGNEYWVSGPYDSEFVSGKNSMYFVNCKDRINLK